MQLHLHHVCNRFHHHPPRDSPLLVKMILHNITVNVLSPLVQLVLICTLRVKAHEMIFLVLVDNKNRILASSFIVLQCLLVQNSCIVTSKGTRSLIYSTKITF